MTSCRGTRARLSNNTGAEPGYEANYTSDKYILFYLHSFARVLGGAEQIEVNKKWRAKQVTGRTIR